MSTTTPTKNGSFLPKGYKVPDKSKQFMKLKPGENKIRFLSTPLLGSVYFCEEKKPIRKDFALGEFTAAELAANRPKIDAETGKPETPKHFWLALVWDYSENAPKALELTQITIIKPLNTLVEDEDWGDLRDFDIVITKSGSSKNDTEYSVIPKPKKPLTKEVQAILTEIEEKQIYNQNAVLESQYPFISYNY